MARLVYFLLFLLAQLPLSWIQALGALLGRLTYWLSPRYTNEIKKNLAISQMGKGYSVLEQEVKRCCIETGKNALELAIAWCRPTQAITRLVVKCEGWEHVEMALAQNKGIVFVTPHLGNYEITGRYISSRLPFGLIAMFRPPKLHWLEPIMQKGRKRDNGQTAPANSSGVRQIIKALRAGKATMILPDQVPGKGEGIWAPFFGEMAYTMTLVPRLAQMDQVQILFCMSERLTHSKGFTISIELPNKAFADDKLQDTTLLNQQIEQMIRRCPSQYLWSYNRYKCPAGVNHPLNSSKE